MSSPKEDNGAKSDPIKDPSEDPGRDQTWFLINVIMHTESKKLEKVSSPYLATLNNSITTNIYSTPGQLGGTRQSAGHFQGRSVRFQSWVGVFIEADLP